MSWLELIFDGFIVIVFHMHLVDFIKKNEFLWACREVLDEFSLNLTVILLIMLKAMARCLDLKDDSVIKEHGERGSIDTRFGIYPRCARPDQVLLTKCFSLQKVLFYHNFPLKKVKQSLWSKYMSWNTCLQKITCFILIINFNLKFCCNICIFLVF